MSDAVRRFSDAFPCPVCGGHQDTPRHIGERCWGFLSSDGVYAHCTRPERAGGLPWNPGSNGYAHRLLGACRCGHDHGADAFDAAMLAATTPKTPSARAKNRARPRAAPSYGRPIATYTYTDADGVVLFQVVRFDPKAFRQRRPDPDLDGGWIWNLDGVTLTLYRLPDLLAAPLEETVYIAEGEKAVDRLRGEGVTATCSPGGAGKWRAAYAALLRGRPVVVLEDNDDAGHRHGDQIARSLAGVAASVRVLQFPELPERGDVSDWLDGGGTAEALAQRAARAPRLDGAGAGPCACGGDCCARLPDLAARLETATAAEHRWHDLYRGLHAVHTDTLRVLKNPHIKAEARTALATTFYMAGALAGQRQGADGFVHMPVATVAAQAGVSPRRLSDHLATLSRRGVFEVTHRMAYREVRDQKTGDPVRRPVPEVFVRALAAMPETLAALAALGPDDGKAATWGGRRTPLPACPDHPDAEVVARPHCATCNRLLDGSDASDSLCGQDDGIGAPPLCGQDDALENEDLSVGQDDGIGDAAAARWATLGQALSSSGAPPLCGQDDRIGRCRVCAGPTAHHRPVCLLCQAEDVPW